MLSRRPIATHNRGRVGSALAGGDPAPITETLSVVLDDSPIGPYVPVGTQVTFSGSVSSETATVVVRRQGGADLGTATVNPSVDGAGWWEYAHTFSAAETAFDVEAHATEGGFNPGTSSTISITVTTLASVAGSGLVDSWRADAGVAADRTTWTGVNGAVWTASTTAPSAGTLTQTGLPALAFNGTSDAYVTSHAGSVAAFAGNDIAHSVLFVFELTADIDGSTAPTLFCAASATPTQPFHIYRWLGTQDYMQGQRRGDGGGSVTTSNPTGFENLFSRGATYDVLCCFITDGGGAGVTTCNIWVNGLLVHSNKSLNVTGTLTITELALCCQRIAGVNSVFAPAKIAEVAIWNTNQSANAATIRTQYVKPRYFDSALPGAMVLTSNALTKTAVNNTIVARAIATRGTEQISAWYDHELVKMYVAKRTIGSRDWVTTITGLDRSTPAGDSHNVIALCPDSAGHWHVWLDMHNDSHRHCRGPSPGDVTFPSLGAFPLVSGSTTEASVTYPEPLQDAGGTLYEIYRSGMSGNGDLYIIRSADGATWEHVVQLTDVGGGGRSPYPNQVCFDSSGRLVFSWTYRNNGSNNNEDIYCLRFDPSTGVATRLDGTVQTLPITTASLPPAVDLGNEDGLINNQGMCLDDSGNPIIVAHYDNGGLSGDTQVNAHRWNGTTWVKTVLTSFSTPYHFDVATPSGMNNARISRPNAFFRDGMLFVVLVATDLGPGIWCLRATAGASGTLTPQPPKRIMNAAVGLWEPGSVDRVRWERDGVLAMNVMVQPFTLANTAASLDPIDANAQASMFGVLEKTAAQLADTT